MLIKTFLDAINLLTALLKTYFFTITSFYYNNPDLAIYYTDEYDVMNNDKVLNQTYSQPT